MKKTIKYVTCIAGAAVMASLGLAGCSEGKNFVNGPKYEYRLTDKTEEYVVNTTGSSVTVDQGIVIDGVFDEAFYTNRKWLKANKILQQSGQTETGTLEMTTYFSETGIVVAAHITDSRAAVYSSSVATGNQTCFSGYFAFGDTTTSGDDVYEVENTAANMFKISEFVSGGLQVMYTSEDVTPVHAVRRVGDITKGECYEYYVEYFMPYALFGRTSRPVTVYFNPTMISATLDEYGSAISDLRTWYNFGDHQSSLYGWSKPNSGYVFDRNGFVSNTLTIKEAEGGTVTEEWGYDWTITGDMVNLNVTPDEGYRLTHLYVNGEECVDDVVAGTYSFMAQGNVTVVPEFAPEGNIVVSDVYAWIGYPASEFTLELNNGESDYTLDYDTSKLTIDKDAKTVKALAEGTFEVNVTSGSDTTSFSVICSNVDKNGTEWNNSDYLADANNLKGEYSANGTDGKTTVFIGDSFFDVADWGWQNFYSDYAGKDALGLGISSSTTFDWESFLLAGDTILSGMQPKNVVVNIGTNNIYDDNRAAPETVRDLQRLFTLLHDRMPDANIYYFSIAQRADTKYAAQVSAVNDAMEQWCEYKDWITFVDVEDQISASDLKDGVHPKNETYTNVYVPALEAAECKIEEK